MLAAALTTGANVESDPAALVVRASAVLPRLDNLENAVGRLAKQRELEAGPAPGAQLAVEGLELERRRPYDDLIGALEECAMQTQKKETGRMEACFQDEADAIKEKVFDDKFYESLTAILGKAGTKEEALKKTDALSKDMDESVKQGWLDVAKELKGETQKVQDYMKFYQKSLMNKCGPAETIRTRKMVTDWDGGTVPALTFTARGTSVQAEINLNLEGGKITCELSSGYVAFATSALAQHYKMWADFKKIDELPMQLKCLPGDGEEMKTATKWTNETVTDKCGLIIYKDKSSWEARPKLSKKKGFENQKKPEEASLQKDNVKKRLIISGQCEVSRSEQEAARPLEEAQGGGGVTAVRIGDRRTSIAFGCANLGLTGDDCRHEMEGIAVKVQRALQLIKEGKEAKFTGEGSSVASDLVESFVDMTQLATHMGLGYAATHFGLQGSHGGGTSTNSGDEKGTFTQNMHGGVIAMAQSLTDDAKEPIPLPTSWDDKEGLKRMAKAVLPGLAVCVVGAVVTAGGAALFTCGPIIAKALVTIAHKIKDYLETWEAVKVSNALLKELDFTKEWSEALLKIGSSRLKGAQEAQEEAMKKASSLQVNGQRVAQSTAKVEKSSDFLPLTTQTLHNMGCFVSEADKYFKAIENTQESNSQKDDRLLAEQDAVGLFKTMRTFMSNALQAESLAQGDTTQQMIAANNQGITQLSSQVAKVAEYLMNIDQELAVILRDLTYGNSQDDEDTVDTGEKG